MTDQPTDHRAEAEEALVAASDCDGYDLPRAQALALLGIGHALLALGLEPVEREYVPATLAELSLKDLTEGIRIKSEQIRAMTDAELLPEPDDAATVERDYGLQCQAHGTTGRCILPAGHKQTGEDGAHRFPDLPPVSVSEG